MRQSALPNSQAELHPVHKIHLYTPSLKKIRHISSISTYSSTASPAYPASLSVCPPFSQLFPMSIPETHFTCKRIFRYSEEYASIKTGLRSFEVFCLAVYVPLAKRRDYPRGSYCVI